MNARAGQTGAVTELVFTIFRKAYPFFPVPSLSASGQKRK